MPVSDYPVARRRLRSMLCLAYGAAGILHLALPAPFLRITPEWVPYPREVILLTGLCEIAGAIGLLIPQTRKLAGIALAAYAACVFPANIKHAFDSLGRPDPSLWAWIYHLVRLPLQPPFVWAPLFAGGLLTWPLAASRQQRQAQDIPVEDRHI